MPPHCDTMDGPVVKAAKKALETGDATLILPWVPRKAELELKKAFEKTLSVRKLGKEASELADYWFYETAVRLHREGEGAPYTGLKPAGLDWGPVVPKAEEAIEKGDAKEVITFMTDIIGRILQEKFHHTMAKKNYDRANVDAARDYVQAMLGFVLYSHHLYTYAQGGTHEEGKGHEH